MGGGSQITPSYGSIGNNAFTPITQQNAAQVGTQAQDQLAQGNLFNAAIMPLETIMGMTGQQQNTSQPTQANPILSPLPPSDGNTPTFNNTPTNTQPYAPPTPPTGIGSNMNINQFVTSSGNAAPLGAQPNFVPTNSGPNWTPAQNNFNGVINGVPTQTGSMLTSKPPTQS